MNRNLWNDSWNCSFKKMNKQSAETHSSESLITQSGDSKDASLIRSPKHWQFDCMTTILSPDFINFYNFKLLISTFITNLLSNILKVTWNCCQTGNERVFEVIWQGYQRKQEWEALHCGLIIHRSKAFSLQFWGDFELDVMRERAELCAKRHNHVKV